jgi:spermidine synthase
VTGILRALEHTLRDLVLLLIAFLSGAILMALEMVGIRVVTPDFGGDIYVLGSLIGVFLAALSLGYSLGGKMADRWPSPLLLGGLLALAGLNVVLLSFYRKPVNEWIFDTDFGRGGALLASVVLFFLPAVLMGTTSPFVIRLVATSIDHLGRTAGAVYAVSTVGSIAGTLGTSFYLINYLQVPNLIRVLGGALVLTGIVSSLLHRRARASVAAVALLAICLTAGPASAERILLERDSPYHRLIVSDDGRYRYLRADRVWHTQMDLRDKHGRGLPYTDYIDLAFLFDPDIKDMLVIGLGGGTIPKRFVRDYPNVTVDVVEIDPDVVKIADKYFDVQEGPRLKINTADGRVFLRRTKKKYDLIMLDAYYADTVPFFLTTKEFFDIVKDHLTPGGVFVNNVIGTMAGPRSKFYRSVYRTMDEVFPHVTAFKVADSGPITYNIEIFAVNTREGVSLGTLRRRAKEMQNEVIRDRRLTQRVEDVLSRPPRTNDVPTLTDDYAPVDALLHLW